MHPQPISSAAQLDGMLGKYSPEIAARARAILKKMRARLPGAVELVYDNYNALAIGFGPNEVVRQAVFSIALYPRWVSLFFLQRGPELDDPERLLKGSGTTVRHIVIDDPAQLDSPPVEALIAQALARATTPIDPKGKRRLVIKSISAKQRPRRPE